MTRSSQTRVLYLSPTAQLGGAELSLLDLAEQLDRDRFAAKIVCLGDGPLIGAGEARGVPVESMPVPRAFVRTSLRGARTGTARMASAVARALPTAWRLRALARAHRADIIHSNGNKTHLLSLAAVVGTRARLVWHVRDFLPDGSFERALARLANRRADAVVANSEAVAAHLRRLGFRSDLVHPILNGIDCRRFSPDGAAADVREEFGWKTDCRIVGLVGMLAPWKGGEIFLRAAKRIAETRDDVRFLFVGAEIYATDGHGGFRERLARLAQDLGIADAVAFTGYRHDVPALLRALDVVVHASMEPEPFGRVIAEAMACGRPVVATHGGGVPEVAGSDGHAAVLVPRGDSAAIAGAVTTLLDDRPRASAMGDAGRARACEHLSLASHVESIEALYTRLASRCLKVLHAGKFYPPVPGGMETVLGQLCTATSERWDVTAVVAHDQPRTVREAGGVRVVRAASFGRAASVPLCPTLPWHLWRKRYDCVVLHEPNPATGLALSLYTPARRLIIWHHSDIVRPRWAPFVYGFVQRRLYRRAACVVTSSPTLALHSPVMSHARRTEMIPYGIDLGRYADAGPAEWKRADAIRARHRAPLVLFVGRLVYYKGLDVLLDAMARCPGTLVIAGDGPLAGALHDRAARLGIAERVVFTQTLTDDDLVSHYLAADVFAMPSTQRTEAFGIAQVEAMACGLPVVSTDLPTGVPWVNQHGITGFVVPPGDVKALATAINRLLEDWTLRRKMGEAGRQRAREHFSREQMIERFVALVERVTSE